MGILLRPNEAPTPSCGMPSMNILTCLPLNPSIIRDMSEPTPPDSLNFSPGAFESASLRFFVVFCISRVSTAMVLKADFFTLPTPPATTTTSLSFVSLSMCSPRCLLCTLVESLCADNGRTDIIDRHRAVILQQFILIYNIIGSLCGLIA